MKEKHSQNYAAGIPRIHRHYHSSADCSEYQKNLLKSSHPENTLSIFPTPKNPGIETFWTPKKSFSIIPVA